MADGILADKPTESTLWLDGYLTAVRRIPNIQRDDEIFSFVYRLLSIFLLHDSLGHVFQWLFPRETLWQRPCWMKAG